MTSQTSLLLSLLLQQLQLAPSVSQLQSVNSITRNKKLTRWQLESRGTGWKEGYPWEEKETRGGDGVSMIKMYYTHPRTDHQPSILNNTILSYM